MASSFNEVVFEKKLLNLKETQESITALSAWCLQHRDHHKAIVTAWLKILKKVNIAQRLTLFYLANDVIQYSKRKNLHFVESWGTSLQKATTMVRDEKVKNKILRLFKIWNERDIYDEAFLSDLCGLLTTNTKKNANSENTEFQPNIMFEKMRAMEKLEDNTDTELKLLNENPLKLNNVKQLDQTAKDRRTSGCDITGELEDGVNRLKSYIGCLEIEITERTSLIELLEQAESFYEGQRKEAKVVSNAYKNFGNRLKNVRRKVDELISALPSPIPSPDINAPSPSPENDFDLPLDNLDYSYNPSANNTTFSQFNNSDFYTPPATNSSQNTSYDYTPSSFTSGFSSFIGSATLPFDIEKTLFTKENEQSTELSQDHQNAYEGNPIEVIGGSAPTNTLESSNVPPVKTSTGIKTPDITIENILNMFKQPPPNIQSTAMSELPSPSPEPLSMVPPPPSGHLAPPPLPPSIFEIDEFKTPDWLRNAPPSMNSHERNVFNHQGSIASTHNILSNPPPPIPPPVDYNIPPRNPNTHPLPAKFPTWDSIDTPASPPSFEKESYIAPNEYIGDTSGVDIDDRSLPVISRLRNDLDLRQATDIDHRNVNHRNQTRNLISLTGSPAIDTDYRSIPVPLSPGNNDSNSNVVDGANTESVDMDLSEDEEHHPSPGKSWFKGAFNINAQKKNLLESPLVENKKPKYKPPILSEEKDSPSSVTSLDIDPSLIKLDANAEKLLSSINIESITNVSKSIQSLSTPTSAPVTPQNEPYQEHSKIETLQSTPAPSPVASSSSYTPRHNFNGQNYHQRTPNSQYMGYTPRTPRFRSNFDPTFRRALPPMESPQRFSPYPRMVRGGFRPRWNHLGFVT